MNEFIQRKRRSITLPKKSAVQVIGKQSDGNWIVGGGVCISPKGELLPEAESSHVWISGVFAGPGIPSPAYACSITLPLSTHPLKPLLCTLADKLCHNFYPSLLLLGSTALMLHYELYKAIIVEM